MGWRLYLSNQAVQRLDILPGKPALLAVWMTRGRIYFFDQETGVPMGEQTIKDPPVETRADDRWPIFVAALMAPNKAWLPRVRTPLGELYISNDGQLRLVHAAPAELYVELEGKEVRLETGDASAFGAIALDRLLGLVAALDDTGRLHLFQQHIALGVFDLGLTLADHIPAAVAVAQGGGAVFVSDGHQIVLTDSGGQVRKRLETHYTIGRMACSPNGRLLATTDMETNVIRVYNGADLTPMYQRHAVDLLAQARQVQLIADVPPAMVALNGLAVGNKGALAFALGGVICASATSEMDALPRAQKLL